MSRRIKVVSVKDGFERPPASCPSAAPPLARPRLARGGPVADSAGLRYKWRRCCPASPALSAPERLEGRLCYRRSSSTQQPEDRQESRRIPRRLFRLTLVVL